MSVSLQSQILILDSRQKNSGTNQNANYSLLNTGGIGANNSVYEMLAFHSVNQMYNVEAGVNDKVYFDEGVGLLTATLDPGMYNTTTMLAEIDLQMSTVSPVNYNGSTLAAATGKYTFAISAGTFQFLFAANTAASGRRLLGMDAFDDALAATHISDNVPDLKLHSNILITIPQEGNKHVTLIDGSEFSLLIPLDTNFSAELHHRKEEHYQQLLSFATNVASIDVELYTQDGVALKNTPDYELVLRRII